MWKIENGDIIISNRTRSLKIPSTVFNVNRVSTLIHKHTKGSIKIRIKPNIDIIVQCAPNLNVRLSLPLSLPLFF